MSQNTDNLIKITSIMAMVAVVQRLRRNFHRNDCNGVKHSIIGHACIYSNLSQHDLNCHLLNFKTAS